MKMQARFVCSPAQYKRIKEIYPDAHVEVVATEKTQAMTFPVGLSQNEVLGRIRMMVSCEKVVLKKNSQGVFTINGRDPEPNETMWWDYEKIPRTIIDVKDTEQTEISIYKEGEISYLLTFDTANKTLISLAQYTIDCSFEPLEEATFDKYNSQIINYYRVTEQPIDNEVVFRRNEAGKYTIDGCNVVAKWDYLYFDGVTLGHDNPGNRCYAYYTDKTLGSFAFTFTRDTGELIDIHNSTHGERIDELTVYRNSSLVRNYKELGPLNMIKVIPYTKLELHVSGIAINNKPITASRNYEWRVKTIGGMEVLLDGNINVKVPEATPPVSITIDKFGKIQTIKDMNGDNRLEVQIPNDSEFLKHLYYVKEVTHLEYIKEQ